MARHKKVPTNKIVGWTGKGDVYCCLCSAEFLSPRDAEPVFRNDIQYYPLTCCECGDTIRTLLVNPEASTEEQIESDDSLSGSRASRRTEDGYEPEYGFDECE